MVHPNILHFLSQFQSFRFCPCSSPLSSSLSLAFPSVIRCFFFFTPYSLRQHWNGFILGASTFLEDAEFPSTCLRVVALRAFRSSRSPHKRNSFSRRVPRAEGDLRRLGMRMRCQPWHQRGARRLTPLLRRSIDLLHLGRSHKLQYLLFPRF